MKLIIVLSIIVFALVILVAKFANYSMRIDSKEKREAREVIISDILSCVSMKNAKMVNTSSSCKNGPVRPQHESFYDGLLNEITKVRDSELPESKLMGIRSFVIDNFAEDANGTL